VAKRPKKKGKLLSDRKFVCLTCGHVLAHTSMGYVADKERADELEERMLAMLMLTDRSCPVCNSTEIGIEPL